MISHLDPLNFVVDIFNEKIHPQLKLREDLWPDAFTESAENPTPFTREILCFPGLAVNDNILPSIDQGYWVSARTSNRDNLTTFEGVKERAAAIAIAMGVDLPRMFNLSTAIGETEQLAIRKRGFAILEFLEKESLRQFSKYNRLRNQISMTDDFAQNQALRRFVVLIRA